MITNNDIMAGAFGAKPVDESSLNNEPTPNPGAQEGGQAPGSADPVPTPGVEPTPQPAPDNTPPAGGDQPSAGGEPQPAAEPEPVPTPTKSFEDLLIEKSEGTYKTWEDVIKATTPTEPTPLDERLQKVQSFLDQGGSWEQFLMTQATDYDKVSDYDLVKEKMLRDNPGMEAQDVEFLMSRKYKLNEEDHDEDAIRLSKLQLKQEANTARDVLKKAQQEYKIPERDDAGLKAKLEQQQAEQKKAFEQRRQEWIKNVDTTVNDLQEVTFKVGEQEFKHSVTDEQRGKVKELNADMASFFNKYQKEDGTMDMNQLHRDRYILEYFPEIMRNAVAQAKSVGAEGAVGDLSNPNLTPTPQTPTGGPKSIESQVKDKMHNIW